MAAGLGKRRRVTSSVACTAASSPLASTANQVDRPSSTYFSIISARSRIDRFASMSNMKSDALREQGIEIVEQVAIPDELIPADAQVEMDAKKAAGYFTEKKKPGATELAKPKGRGLNE